MCVFIATNKKKTFMMADELAKTVQELMEKHHITAHGYHKPTSATTPTIAQASVSAPATGTKKALLIGINYYGSSNQLRGCQEDVRNMKDYLQTKGFTQFTVLMDSRADKTHQYPDCPTRANIVAAMKSLIAGAVRGDMLWVHYSGHGSQLPCKPGDPNTEKDGQDECICPVDFDFDKPDAGFIRDNDLNKILVAALPAGVKLRVCFDSCHSGSALDLPYMWSTGMKVMRETNLVVDRDVVFISGCRDNQTSADATIDGNASGAMTWSLLESIADLPADHKVHWEDLVALMRKTLATHNYDQVPQLSIENPDQLKVFIDI